MMAFKENHLTTLFAATVSGQLAVIMTTMKSASYQSLFDENARPIFLKVESVMDLLTE